MNIYDAARPFRDAFNYDPGHSDLDDEQPISIGVMLGDWRRLNLAMGDEAMPVVLATEKGLTPTGQHIANGERAVALLRELNDALLPIPDALQARVDAVLDRVEEKT